MDINEKRAEIDSIDTELTRLFVKRMNAASEIAAYKKEAGLPVPSPIREREILTRLAGLAGDSFAPYVRTLYGTVFDLSRSYQSKLIGHTGSRLENILKTAENTAKVFPEAATVACQGREGAYSQLAAERLFKAPDIVYNTTFEGVIKSVESGLCKFGILPVENSSAGSVNAVYDLLMTHGVSIVRSVRVKVDHSLLALPGASLSEIKTIYSHEMAISQCSGFISGLNGVSVIPYANTAAAAEAVALSNDRTKAAISSRFCAGLYGLHELKGSLQNRDNNYTRFICFTKEPSIYPGADRTSLMIVIPNKPGSLFRVLSRFNALGLNLIKLESRPIPERDFETMFYFDIEASVYSPEFGELISELDESCETLKYLGTYSETV